ncbi:MAG: peptide ABC transporter substrate-binding protein [Acetobacteraceae bacterium]|nr:peptide ABC transporter substrate-binding protein [Acetobacteraceae bacterium]
MTRWASILTAAILLFGSLWGGPSAAEKAGGTLRVYHRDSPASMSIHEEGTVGVIMPMMGVMNNLIIYDQHIPRNEPGTIIPELATAWAWSSDGTALTFQLRQGVRWHDGKPFTANDVKCTFDLLTNQGKEKLRLNYRESWWVNIAGVTVNGAHEATIRLKRPQPPLLALLASGDAPMYPCHVHPRDMRQHPIGTGPFRFVDYKPNQSIKIERNPDYWKPGRPYLDGVEYTIIPNRSTALLAFVADKFDMTFPNEVTVPLLADLKAQAPQVVCEVTPTSDSVGVLINRTVPPFDNGEVRRAMALTLDRKAFIDILAQGAGDIGGAMQPPPDGAWGLPREMLASVPGHGEDVAKNRAEARAIMRGLGYGPDKRLPVKVSVRNLAAYRDPGTILIDQLREIYFEGELELTETATWVPKLIKKDYVVGLNVLGVPADDPDIVFFQNHVCGSARNYTGHCNRELDMKIERQSMETDPMRRRQLVWEIDQTLQQELARPILYHRRAGTCWHPWVKGMKMMVNSQYNGWRMEDVWMDR